MSCAVCGRMRPYHGSEDGRPGTYLSEAGCHNGVFMDDDEHAEGWDPSVVTKPCQFNPARCARCDGTGDAPADVTTQDDCPDCGGSGWRGGRWQQPDGAIMSEREQDCSSSADRAASVASQPDCSAAQSFPGGELITAPDATGEILAALRSRCEGAIWASELAFDGGARRCDFWTISANSSVGFQAIAYEIKVSRSDFKRDTHAKQRQARLFSDRFYYVTPTGLIRPEELPDWAGLMEYGDGKLTRRVDAPHRDKDAPTWQLVVSLIRNSGEIRRDTDLLRKENALLKRQINAARERLQSKGLPAWQIGL